MELENDLLAIAERDLQTSVLILGATNDEIMQNLAAYHTQQAIEKIIKYLLIKARGYANNEHDIERLAVDAKSQGINIPGWVEDNSYEISRWATTIRYNSNFRTNRDLIVSFNKKTTEWMNSLKKQKDRLPFGSRFLVYAYV